MAVSAACLFVAGVAAPFPATVAGADVLSGNLFYTTFCGVPNVHRVTWTYDDVARVFSLGPSVDVASTVGADGIIWLPDANLLIGGQGTGTVHEVDPATGAVLGTQHVPDHVFHLSLNPTGTGVYGADIPGRPDLIDVPLPPGTSFGGTPVTLTGTDATVDSIIFPPSFATDNKAFYTNAGTGGNGNIGVIEFSSPTVATTQMFMSLPASHSGVYDPFTDTIMFFGDSHVTQFTNDTNAPAMVSDLHIPQVGSMDQGQVDGEGHAFVADNGGRLVFIDYSATGRVGDPSSFVTAPFLANCLDDIPQLGGAAPPDLSINKTVDEDAVVVGQTVHFTLTVANSHGNGMATGVTVTEPLPAGLQFISATPSQGTCGESGGVLTCALGTLASGARATIDLEVLITDVGTITNTATVFGDRKDPIPENNEDSRTIRATPSPFPPPSPPAVPPEQPPDTAPPPAPPPAPPAPPVSVRISLTG